MHCPAPLIIAIAILHGIRVSPEEGVLDLMMKHKARNASDKLSQEHQRQERGIQLQHPWATMACGKAFKQAKNDDGGASPNEQIRSICGILSSQGAVGAMCELASGSGSQQDHLRDPEDEGADDGEGSETGYHRFALYSPRCRTTELWQWQVARSLVLKHENDKNIQTLIYLNENQCI